MYFEGRIQPLKFKINDESAVLWQATNVTQRYLLEEKLRMISETDLLTGAWNRRHFYQVVAHEKKRSERLGSAISLLMLDLDHFKKINDQWGHTTGDSVLNKVVSLINDCMRDSDVIIRWGGEEFIIFMPDTQQKDVTVICEKLRYTIECYQFKEGFKVTVSIGYTEWDFAHNSIEEAVDNIDSALYLAKNNGRNCVKCYQDENLKGKLTYTCYTNRNN